MAASTERLRLDQLEVGYERRAILPPISTGISSGQTWALVGRNGSGKSSLLRTLVGAQPAIGGQVHRAGGVRLSWVPQRDAVVHTIPLRGIDVVRTGVARGWNFVRPWHTRQETRQIQDALRLTDCEHLAHQRYNTLSEGQKQRVLIARALASQPDVVLLDEPTSAMDRDNTQATLSCLDRLRADTGLTIIFASHHARGIPEIATHAILVDRETNVVEFGPAAQVAQYARLAP